MADTTHSVILRACYSFLLPVARFLLRAGISFREFEELGRKAFVEVSASEFGLRQRPTNTSRIAAMTGIPRKEVKRLREAPDPWNGFPRQELSPLGDILHHWYTHPQYLDFNGLPLPLKLDGDEPSFEMLARLCAGDLPPGALKVELVRAGAAEIGSDGFIRVLKRVAVPNAFDEKLVTSLSFNLYALASTIAFNSNPHRKTEGRIERFVQSEKLPAFTTQKLKPLIRRRIESFSEDLDDMFSAAERGCEEHGKRVGVGVYYYEDDLSE
jgi:hypothetical protein